MNNSCSSSKTCTSESQDKILEIAKKNVLRKSSPSVLGKEIHGYNFSDGINYDSIMNSFETTGFQASHLAKTINIINDMCNDKVTIFLGYTSNMVTSGLRDIIRFLVETNQVHVIVTTAGGVEEDIIKCLKPFHLGDFNASGADLREKSINRTGNIFVPNDNYCAFEDFFIPFLGKLLNKQKTQSFRITPSKLIYEMGLEINNKESIYYWASKHNIPVFCPALTDGSMGDMIFFFMHKHPDFILDIAEDIFKLNTIAIEAKKSGIILLGAGIIKHHICNANMMRNGADYAVYINTSQEFDGSDAGARPDEAVSWGKILPEGKTIKLFADATIVFPLIVAQTFAKKM